MIDYINVSRINPHPDNPRKGLGDLTELAESIKTNGILQNLTVVPGHEAGDYTVVIGHRRLAAAKLAGEVTVPCVVSDMSQKQQVATMLLENIQRSDLTIFEQAQGFQMMLDFGDTVAEISKQTGFSDTTIRRRVKLMELDQDKLRKSMERGATLMDYAELDKIKDPQSKNKVLDKIGTPNFKYELQSAIDSEKAAENKAKLLEQLKQFATQVKEIDYPSMARVAGYYPSHGSEVTVPDDADTKEYFYLVESYGGITLYAKRGQGETDPKVNAEVELRNKQQARKAALDEITKRAYKLRCDFVREVSNAQAKKSMGAIVSFTLRSLLDGYFNLDYDDLFDALGIEVGDDNEDRELNFDMVAERVADQPERHLLVAIYLAADSEGESYYNWQGQYQNNEALNNAYNLLEELGYQISDEEQALRDGSHELFGGVQ